MLGFLALAAIVQQLSAADQVNVEALARVGGSCRIEVQPPDPPEVWIDFDNPVADRDLRLIQGLGSLTALRLLAGGFTDRWHRPYPAGSQTVAARRSVGQTDR